MDTLTNRRGRGGRGRSCTGFVAKGLKMYILYYRSTWRILYDMAMDQR